MKGRSLSRPQIGRAVSRLIQFAKHRVLFPLGVNFYLRKEDRRILEQVIFPYLVSRSDLKTIVFVGCEIYTRGYNRVFRRKNYITLDVEPHHRKFGAKQHIVDRMENITEHFMKSSVDVVVCNGVFGWGLDDPVAADRAIQGVSECLRFGGLFIVGWNDIPERCPFKLADCPSTALFSPFEFPALGTSEYLTHTGNRHTYTFFAKR
jgi:SAM-dependent methyltransferase